MGTVIDLVTRLPVEIWFNENSKASDIKFEADILNLVTTKTGSCAPTMLEHR